MVRVRGSPNPDPNLTLPLPLPLPLTRQQRHRSFERQGDDLATQVGRLSPLHPLEPLLASC